ncbi:NADP-dependent oxidoreductase [Saccharopolyspora sp. NPDC047091]|uniref:NADP-dependent oxidoreductase n=1 Tax=Saccharopolyspora sp. NPDC047091 TaxID=3155924 RepID=UPI0033ECA6A8
MTVPTTGTEIRLASRPDGAPTPENFTVARAELPEVGPGQVLVRNLVLSVDPYMRGRMNNVRTYVPPFQIGKPLEGGAVGEVLVSRSPQLSAGDVVLHGLGWREYAVVGAAGATRVDTGAAPPEAYLGALGMPGHAAYAGLLEAAEFRPGDTVFVSGAAGTVGSIVGQIAKLRGAAKVIGSAGGPEKVRYLTEELGFDRAFDYRDGPIWQQLVKASPDGFDVYFDNVGGDHLDAALLLARPGARFALCGAISQYNEQGEVVGPRNLMQAIGKGITMRGFLVGHYEHVKDRFLAEMGGWLARGDVRCRETVVKGVENTPQAFLDMLGGKNTGKTLVRVD